MAAAVSAAGGLGSIGVGASTVEVARAMVAEAREARGGARLALNANVFCNRPARADAAREAAWCARLEPAFAELGASAPRALKQIYRSFVGDDEMLAMLVELKPEVVSFHFGLPSEAAIRALQGAGIVLFGSATSLAEARELERAGIDAVVAQGWEAGGHRGMFDPDAEDDELGTMALVRVLVRATRLPVIAAGGIMDGAGIAAAMDLGAVAAQLGTAFIGCSESLADAGYRAALASDAAHHTTMTRAISGRPARCLANRFTRLGADIRPADIPDYPIAYDAGKALHAAGKARSEYGYGAQWAGQGAALARSLSAGELIRALAEELRQSAS